MLALTTVFLIFGFIPALLGHVAYIRGSYELRTRYINKLQAVRSWTATEHSRAAFIACTIMLYAAGVLAMTGAKLNAVTSIGLLLASCFSALIYLCCHWNVLGFSAKYGSPLKLVGGAIAIGIATISKIYSDAGIAELTGLSPQDLPGAQLLLTFLLTPTIWFLGLSLFFGYISIPVMLILFFRLIFKSYRKTAPNTKYESGFPDVTVFVAVSFFVLILLTMTQEIASKSFYEIRLRKAIAFASFHLSTTYCGLPDVKGIEVAPMSDDRAAIAIPDEKLGYRFEPISCKPKSTIGDELNVILDKYKSSNSTETE